MAHRKKHANPVPPANRAKGPAGGDNQLEEPDRHRPTDGAPFQEEDPKRRLGNFTGPGEHARQQPGPANDGNVHSK